MQGALQSRRPHRGRGREPGPDSPRQRPPNFERTGAEILFTTEDGSLGETGLVTDPLARVLAGEDIATVYCCGPTPMMRACAELAAEHQVTCMVSLENTMACGYGVCLGCAAPRPAGDYALVCRDGPVFDSREIAWEGLL